MRLPWSLRSSSQPFRGRADSRLPLYPIAPDNLEEPLALELPQAAPTNPMEYLGDVYLYFIAQSTKSVRCDQKESRSEAIADSRKQNCPETELIVGFDKNIGRNNPDERLHRLW